MSSTRSRKLFNAIGCVLIGALIGAGWGPLLANWWGDFRFKSELETQFLSGFSEREVKWQEGEGGNDAVAIISVTAEEPVTLLQGFGALSPFGPPISPSMCWHGRTSTVQLVEPEVLSTDPEYRYPAGTRFTQKIKCEGALPNEFELAIDSTDEDARASVEQRLGDADYPTSKRIVSRLSYNDKRQKYVVFREHLGWVTSSVMRQCNGPALVSKIVVGTYPHPTPGQKVFPNNAEMVVGSDIRCADAVDSLEAVAAATP